MAWVTVWPAALLCSLLLVSQRQIKSRTSELLSRQETVVENSIVLDYRRWRAAQKNPDPRNGDAITLELGDRFTKQGTFNQTAIDYPDFFERYIELKRLQRKFGHLNPATSP